MQRGEQKEEEASHRARLLASAALLALTRLAVPASLHRLAALATAAPLYREGMRELRREGLNSHVLEALAVAVATASGDRMAAGATLFLLALGGLLEHSIVRRSDTMLKDLLRPDTGSVWVERDGAEQQVAASEVRVGDTVVCPAGSVIAVDGTVLRGEASVNEASMTGESLPVRRVRGHHVLSGTVVEEGALRVYAEHVGAGTVAARIADYVHSALQVKSATQLAASRLADRLVPGVLALAAASWLLSGNWRRGAAVLQADYACALKLATPVAFKSGMYAAGKGGLLFKGADALEKLASVDTFIFDKTGTLTSGRMSVTDALTFSRDFGPHDVIDLAASLEEHYFHPVALAVVEAARKRGGRHFEHADVDFIAAHGVASVVRGQRIVVGSRHFVEDDEGVNVAAHDGALAPLLAAGKTLLYIGLGGRLVGAIALRDSVRPAAAATLRRLRALGVRRILMLTGDQPERAAALAAQVGVDEYHASLLPDDKAALLARLTREGARVAFVGDGVNDAPALAGAHVGISMQRGADLARLTSDVALLEDDIARVADARHIACATMRRIRSNFRFTVAANTAILGAAALGALSSVAASVLHNGSTIAILLNALRGGLTPAPAGAARARRRRTLSNTPAIST
ncbi:MAG: heavy metal translocating P-type ATPase [Ottowia sp.]|nr:heavy metal translocating P-type ATPase [Ottowia sp.]